MKNTIQVQDLISNVSNESLTAELEKASSRYHFLASWIGVIFNPVFAYTDYINIHDKWKELFIIRLSISLLTLMAIFLGKKFKWPSHAVVAVPILLISLQNGYGYSLIQDKDILGHSINYMALLIGVAMFILWRLSYSLIVVALSILATAIFILMNNGLNVNDFFVNGGLLLIAVALFMIVSIKTRYNLTVKEIKARLALQASNEEIQAQAEEIKTNNENLELLVKARTHDLERKNKALEEYAWINAHKLRSPVASILGLMNILKREEVNTEARIIMNHLQASTEKLDDVISSITKTIESADDLGEPIIKEYSQLSGTAKKI